MSRTIVRSGLRIAVLAGLGLAACSIPDTAFHPSPDGGTGSDMPTVLAIVVSKPAIELDEGATADLGIKLNFAPASPVEVDLSVASQKIGLSKQKLFFDATNFGQDQVVTVTGIADDDTATEIANIKLTGSGVADVMVGATVRDPDKVTIVADISDGATVTEGTSKDVHVHLSHRPPGDVSVTAMMSSGPITVTPAQQVFHMDDAYSTDLAFKLTAPLDPDVVDQSQTITLTIAGGDQKIIQVKDVDIDRLAISSSPSSISHLKEGDTAVINLSLTKVPPAMVTVTASTMTGKAQFVGGSSVTFDATDYMTNKTITIMAPQDTNITPETDTIVLAMTSHPEVTPISIPVQIDDDDVQAIQTTVTNSLTVTEGMTAQFGVTLKFAPVPGSPITVNLSTMDGAVATAASTMGANFLTFDATDYNVPAMHQVVVTGTQDNNLITNSTLVKLVSGTLETDVNVDVTDDDHQAFALSQTTPLSIPEGGSKSFTVALAFQPTTTVHATLGSTDGALVIAAPNPPTIDFTTANWQTPVTVTVNAPVDKNAMSETSTISVTATGIPTVSLMATAVDSTVIETEGWPTPFTGTISERQSAVIAYKIHIGTTTLDSFGIYVPVAAGAFRMALYADAGNKPGTLVGPVTSQFPAVTLVNGVNIVDVSDMPITVGDYWLALRVSATTNVGGTSGTLGRRCVADFDIVGLTNNWSSDFGVSNPATGCGDVGLINIWTTTYHQ